MVAELEPRDIEIVPDAMRDTRQGEVLEIPQKSIVVANCIILNERGEILLLQRDVPGKKQLEVPGGGLRPNESPERAAVRETCEEVGGIDDIEIADRVITTRYKRHGKRRKHVNFLARVHYAELFPKQKMHKSIGFYSWEQLEQMEKTELAANVKQLLRAREEGRLNLSKGNVSRSVN